MDRRKAMHGSRPYISTGGLKIGSRELVAKCRMGGVVYTTGISYTTPGHPNRSNRRSSPPDPVLGGRGDGKGGLITRLGSYHFTNFSFSSDPNNKVNLGI